jgi:hypothetical protein
MCAGIVSPPFKLTIHPNRKDGNSSQYGWHEQGKRQGHAAKKECLDWITFHSCHQEGFLLGNMLVSLPAVWQAWRRIAGYGCWLESSPLSDRLGI